MKDNLFEADEVIELQSSYYYSKAKDDLGFYTIAQNEKNYRKKIAELLEEFSTLLPKDQKIKILELGGGTGKFCSYLTEYLVEHKIQYEYTIVDVSVKQYQEILQKNESISIIEDTFTKFASKNKKQFDILIMNEALDMWAGKQELLQEWTNEQVAVDPYWAVLDLEKLYYVKKKDARKIKQEPEIKYVWQELYYNKEQDNFTINKIPESKDKIHIPDAFRILLEQINLATIVQDYWSFSEQENPLRMGLYEDSVQKTLNKLSHITDDQKNHLKTNWETELSKTKSYHKWIESSIIPFGLVDVTYSPDQSELFDLSIELDLELVNSYAENPNRFDDTIYTVGEKENEIFMLFTKKAVDMQFKKASLD